MFVVVHGYINLILIFLSFLIHGLHLISNKKIRECINKQYKMNFKKFNIYLKKKSTGKLYSSLCFCMN